MFRNLHLIPEQLPGEPPREHTSSGIALTIAKTLTEQAPPPGIALSVRVRLFIELLRAVKLTAPVFELSAARSDSTQLGRYLEEDPHKRLARS